ncbi:6190_t:CDS:2 [Funneliformis geosporum]|uniref:6190_t:CDS:1 n=1 Tax=Funneliformis geosporum TaxID=1117311 RepID=A0A9W4SZH4_9GLOM|nr:6190_t:CDS:2 [Funneliformis geosporum]
MNDGESYGTAFMTGIAFRDSKNAMHPCVGMFLPGGSVEATLAIESLNIQ